MDNQNPEKKIKELTLEFLLKILSTKILKGQFFKVVLLELEVLLYTTERN